MGLCISKIRIVNGCVERLD